MIRKIIDAIEEKGLKHWLWHYLGQSLMPNEKPVKGEPIHIMMCIVDHYEPFHGGVNERTAIKRVKEWVEKYPVFADKHKDADGKVPQHTWFYPPHLDHCFLRDLAGLCKEGYGEIEMHLHHNHMQPFPDTSQTLKQKILKCIEDYSKYGIFCLPDGTKRFGFVHGDWSLDNSRGEKFCGVNDELRILKECGCYADFTFPSLGKAQPEMINKIYYALDDSLNPKSYNKGKELVVGGKPWGDLLMIPGIIGLRWKARTHKWKPSIEASNLDKRDYPFEERVEYWMQNGIRIKGSPNWIFVKLHTHGGRDVDFDCLFGDSAHKMYRYLENSINNKNNRFIHYVTARQMYNIVKAAEAGKKGNPNDYRDYLIPAFEYTP